MSNFIKSENPYTIEDTVYAQYFENNQVIDNELFKALKQLVYNSIRKKYPILQTQTYMQTIIPTGDDAHWSLNSQDIDNFDIILRRGLDNKNSIDSIVQELSAANDSLEEFIESSFSEQSSSDGEKSQVDEITNRVMASTKQKFSTINKYLNYVTYYATLIVQQIQSFNIEGRSEK